MAKRVTTITTCDLHDVEEVDAPETIAFGFGGSAYELDVCPEHASEVRARFKEFTAHGRHAGSAYRASSSGPDRKRARVRSSAPQLARAWAARQNPPIVVAPMGRVPAYVMAQYRAAGAASSDHM
jgi:hypothetical protein